MGFITSSVPFAERREIMMKEKKENQVLKNVTRQIYCQRQLMPSEMKTYYRIERANGGLLCDLWFLSRGCVHDAEGGCTMCNYGKGNRIVQWNEIIGELRHIIKKLPWEFEDFLLTPSGSMLDEREVPVVMRESMKELLKRVRAKRFIVETRVDTIDIAGLKFLQEIMPDSEKYIEIGYESGHDWILRNCINKGVDTEEFGNAVKVIHEAGIKVTANVGVGIPFLSEKASIREAIYSVKRAFEQGADSVVLFPYHVKRGTLLEVMYQYHWYQCISLWSLVAVLEEISENILEQVQISWYKDYFGEERSQIFVSPTTCTVCERDVMDLLDQYRQEPSGRKLSVLRKYNCECREEWKKKMESQSEKIEYGQIEKKYCQLAKEFNVDDNILEKELMIMRETIRGRE